MDDFGGVDDFEAHDAEDRGNYRKRLCFFQLSRLGPVDGRPRMAYATAGSSYT